MGQALTSKLAPISPKRPSIERPGLADVFPYYAGFSFEWARDRVAELIPQNLRDTALVADIWNGSGTTTLAASSLGVSSIGTDLNPITFHVATVRSLNQHHASSVALGKPATASTATTDSEPFNNWFSNASSIRLRQWANVGLSSNTPTDSLLYVAMFRVIRKITAQFVGSNPTWVQRAASDSRLTLADAEIDSLIENSFWKLVDRIRLDGVSRASIDLRIESSSATSIIDSSVTLTVTSPPYLTRIDYAVAYSRELAVLGIDIFSDRRLRSDLMGTTLSRKSGAASKIASVPLASDLLAQISSHSSKDSSGYYLKQAAQYIEDLKHGFWEISRISRVGGHLVIVVQDSYYKNIHVDLAGIVAQQAEQCGWTGTQHHSFSVDRILTTLNRDAGKYQKGVVRESVLEFVKQ